MRLKRFNGLLTILLVISVTVLPLVITVLAKPLEPNPEGVWPLDCVWGTKLRLENTYIGEAWFGAGPNSKTSEYVVTIPDFMQPVFLENAKMWDTYVRVSVAAPQSYSWAMKLFSGGSAPSAGTLSWVLENATHEFIPHDFSIVLDNASAGIHVNLRAKDSQWFSLPTYATFYVDNAVNIENFENTTPLIGNVGENVSFSFDIVNTGRYADNYAFTVNAGGWSVDNWSPDNKVSLGVDQSAHVRFNVTLGKGSHNINVEAAGNYAWDNSPSLTATGLAGPNVEVSITPKENSGLPGENVTFIVTVKNTGNVPDNYNLTVSDNAGWNPKLDENLLQNIAAGENRKTTLRVKIPENATPCTRDNITVTATSQENSEVSDNDTCIAHAARLGVEVSISPSENAVAPGENVTFTVTVKNVGDVSDNYNLTVSDNAGWNPKLDENLLQNIAAGENRKTTLRVAIPGNAENCTRDNITVTATSQENSEVSDNDTCIAHAIIIYGVEVSISPSENAGAPGENVTFTVTVKNTGNVPDNYNLTVSDNAGWNPKLDENLLQNIAAGENRKTTLRVAIPENALPGSEDIITVTATSQGDNTMSDSDNCIARVGGGPGVNVSISPKRMDSTPGKILPYEVTVTNTGFVSDNYTLEVSDNQGWTLVLDDNLFKNVAPRGIRTTTLRVAIPDDAIPCTEDNITVTATSQENTEVSAENSCIAHVIHVKPLEPNPEGVWPLDCVWGTKLRLENLYIGEAWFGAGPTADNTEYLELPFPFMQPVFIEDSTMYDKIVKLSVAAPQSYSWYVKLYSGNEASEKGTLSWVLENATHEFIPHDFSIVLDNQAQGILVNLRAQDNHWFSLPTYATLHVDNAVNIRIENVTPTTAAGGKKIIFDVIVSNTGRYNDTYELSASDNRGWGLVFSPSTLSVNAEASKTATLTATVTHGGANEIMVTANGAYAFDYGKTTAFGLPIWVSISPPENHGLPGKTLSYTVTVKNIGEKADNYKLEVSDTENWPLALGDNLLQNVSPGGYRTTTLWVAIPLDAVGGTKDNITVTATSQENENVKDSVTCTALVDYLGVEVSIRPSSQGGAPGENLNYEVIVKNRGNVDDNYDLEVSERWSAQISPTSLTVPVRASRTATLSVTIPSDASGGDSMSITVTATSQTDNAVSGSARCTAIAEVPPEVPPYVPPEEKPPPGPRLPAEERGPLMLMGVAIFVALLAIAIAWYIARGK